MAESLLLGGYSGSTHDSQYGYIGGIIPIGGGLFGKTAGAYGFGQTMSLMITIKLMILQVLNPR